MVVLERRKHAVRAHKAASVVPLHAPRVLFASPLDIMERVLGARSCPVDGHDAAHKRREHRRAFHKHTAGVHSGSSFREIGPMHGLQSTPKVKT